MLVSCFENLRHGFIQKAAFSPLSWSYILYAIKDDSKEIFKAFLLQLKTIFLKLKSEFYLTQDKAHGSQWKVILKPLVWSVGYEVVSIWEAETRIVRMA